MAASSGWAAYTAKLPFDVALSVKHRLEAQGAVGGAAGGGSWARLLNVAPNGSLLVAFGVTAALAIAVSACRLRFPWWPLHPIIFFFLHSHQIQRLAFSFLLGWALKAAVSKYGGLSTYRKLTPVAVGLVAGEVVAALAPIVAGVTYRAVTGDAPAYHSVFLL